MLHTKRVVLKIQAVASPKNYNLSNGLVGSETIISHNLDEVVISCEESQRLAQEKIDARIRLLAMPLEEAQKLVNQTLYPQHWTFRSEDNIWSETIPTNYGED